MDPVCETVVWSLTSQSKISFKKPPVWQTVVWPTDVLVENDFKKNEKTPVCETVVWPLADQVKNLIKKKTWYVRQRYGLWRVKHLCFSPVFPFFLNFFPIAGSPMKFAEMPTSEECGGWDTPPPRDVSTYVHRWCCVVPCAMEGIAYCDWTPCTGTIWGKLRFWS